jgi:hypothetical protein
MSRDQWKDQFIVDLWAMMAIGGQGTVMVPSAGQLVFGGYIVGFASPRGDNDKNTVRVLAMENVPPGHAMASDGSSWSASLDDDPITTATQVAQWLRTRWHE